MKRIALFLSVFLLATPWASQAADSKMNIREINIQTFRSAVKGGPFAATMFAAGVLTALSPILTCTQDYSIGEFKAFLENTAKPDDLIIEAAFKFYEGRGCKVKEDKERAKWQ